MDTNNGNNLTDRHIVEQVLGGDTQAFSLLIRRTEALVGHIVCKLIVGVEDRKDIVQDVYLKVFNNLAGFGFRSQLSTWVAQIAYNTCLNFLKKKQVVVYHDEPGGLQAIADHGVEQILLKKEKATVIHACMEQLPPVFKLLLSLYHTEEMSYQEIGLITQMPEGTIKSYLFRARKTLREILLRHLKKNEL